MPRKSMIQDLRADLTIARARAANAEKLSQDYANNNADLRNEMRLGVEAQAKRPFRTVNVIMKDARDRIVSMSEHHLDEFDTFNFSSDGHSHQAESTKAV